MSGILALLAVILMRWHETGVAPSGNVWIMLSFLAIHDCYFLWRGGKTK